MKVLIISDDFMPEVNAAAQRVFERAVYWVKKGCEVTVITGAPNAPLGKVYAGYKNTWRRVEMIEGIRVVRVKTFIARRKRFLLRLFDYLSFMISSFVAVLIEEKPDIILATSPQFFVLISGWLSSRVRRSSLLFEIADLWPTSIVAVGLMKRNLLLRFIENVELFLYHRADAIVTLTQYIKEDLLRRGVCPQKISVIRNGVDSKRKKLTDDKLTFELEIQNKFVVGYIGNHGLANDLKNVLLAAKLLQHNSDIHFLFVGDGVARHHLMTLSAEYELPNVTFIPLQLKSTVDQYWQLCDVALIHLRNHPLFSGALPLKLYKAMAMGLPILLSLPKGEASELVEEAEAGVWVPPASPSLLAEMIESLSKDPKRLTYYAENCRMVATNHTREKQALRFLEVIEQLSLL